MYVYSFCLMGHLRVAAGVTRRPGVGWGGWKKFCRTLRASRWIFKQFRLVRCPFPSPKRGKGRLKSICDFCAYITSPHYYYCYGSTTNGNCYLNRVPQWRWASTTLQKFDMLENVWISIDVACGRFPFTFSCCRFVLKTYCRLDPCISTPHTLKYSLPHADVKRQLHVILSRQELFVSYHYEPSIWYCRRCQCAAGKLDHVAPSYFLLKLVFECNKVMIKLESRGAFVKWIFFNTRHSNVHFIFHPLLD